MGKPPPLNIKGFRKRRWAFGELECWGTGGGGWEAEDRCVIVCHRLFAWSFRVECNSKCQLKILFLSTIGWIGKEIPLNGFHLAKEKIGYREREMG